MATELQAIAGNSQSATRGSLNLRRFVLLSWNNFIMYTRNRSALFWVILFPIGYMLLFGAIYGGKNVDPTNPASAKIISFMVPGLVVMSLMSNGIIGNASAMAVWRERGILRRLQTTPLPIWQMLLSRIIVQAFIMVLQAFILIGLSIVVFQASFDTIGLLEVVPVIIVTAIVCMAIGQMLAALVSKPETVQILTQVIYFPLLFLGGLFIPLDQLPQGIQVVGKYLPSAMMGDLIRAPLLSSYATGSTALTNLPFMVSLLGVLVYFLVAIILAVRFFKWN